MINFNMSRETLIYAGTCSVVAGLILGAFILGARQGVRAAEAQFKTERAEIVIDLNQANDDLVSTQIKLTECESRAAGDCALDCESITQERVSQALASCAAICRD